MNDTEGEVMADSDFLEYLQIQGTTDMITKTELIESIRAADETISDRTLTYYTTQGLIPKAVRVGSRAGAYPALALDLVLWLVRARKRNVTIEALRELVPLWRHLVQCRKDRRFDLNEIQFIARSQVESQEANSQIPFLISEVAASVCPTCEGPITWIAKDGSESVQGEGSEISIGFVLAELDVDRMIGRPIAWTQLVLPGFGAFDGDSPTTVILGIPNNVQLELRASEHEASSESQQPDAEGSVK